MSVVSGDYCDIARPTLPDDDEIDRAIDAGLMPLLRRIDVEDEKYFTRCH